MKTISTLILLTISSHIFGAQELTPALNVLANPGVVVPDAANCVTEKKACTESVEAFCKNLWANKGKLQTPNGEIKFGLSPKSETSMAKILDLNTFVDASSKFPEDLKANKEFMSLVQRLKDHLDQENSSSEWGNELAIISFSLENQQLKTSKERVFKLRPDLRSKNEKKFTVDESKLFSNSLYDIKNQIIDAKYKDSANWKMALKVYDEMKANLLTVIEGTSLPADQKLIMTNKLKTVAISLPYTDPRLLGVQETCSRDQVNAFYSPTYNKFTICMGDLNSASTLGNIAFTIGHELAHSFDLTSQAWDRLQSQPIATKFKELISTEGPIKDCSAWNSLVADASLLNQPLVLTSATPAFNVFKNCLIDKKKLRPFSEENVAPFAAQLATNTIDYLATNGYFAESLTKEVVRNGETLPNDYYLNPNRWSEQVGEKIIFDAPTISLFQYAAVCEPGSKEPQVPASWTEAQKEQRLDAAVEVSKKMTVAFNRAKMAQCGDECSELSPYALSKPSGENFSDWFGSRAAALYMKTLPPENRASFANEMTSFLCENPENKLDATFTSAQKKYSSEVHEENRIRRWSLFSPSVAAGAGCELDSSTKGFNQCQL